MSFHNLTERPWRHRPPEEAFAWYPAHGAQERWLSVSEWHGRIGAWQRTLAERFNPGRAWLLFEPDPVEFSAALVAIWERGDMAVLPADDQPGTAAGLANAGTALGRFPGAVSAGDSEAPTWSHDGLPAIALSLYTSGSTGNPQRLDKSFDQLAAELATQATLWPLENHLIISQVSHQHIYGLLFTILRPLCESVPFAAQICRYPETLRAWLQHCHRRRAVLVSAPPALSRLPATLDWTPVQETLERIYSSGAPLSRIASDQVRERLATPVYEVYGSSETGGIAWRVQQQGDEWIPFPGIAVRADAEQRLWLRSPHLDAPNRWQRQADRIALTEHGFLLQGRADRIVKIGGKRLSLTAMDRALSELPGVERAQALALERRDLRLAAIVQLSATLLPHDHRSHRDTVKRLRQALAERFETPALPRYWRFVSDWPTNAQGKLSADIRRRLFQDLDDRRAPRWLGERLRDGIWTLALEVPEHSLYLEGHFDTQAVLPGIALVHWAMPYARRLFAFESDFAALERLRFPQPLLPGDRFEMTLDYRHDASGESLRIQCDSRRGRHASARVALRREGIDAE